MDNLVINFLWTGPIIKRKMLFGSQLLQQLLASPLLSSLTYFLITTQLLMAFLYSMVAIECQLSKMDRIFSKWTITLKSWENMLELKLMSLILLLFFWCTEMTLLILRLKKVTLSWMPSLRRWKTTLILQSSIVVQGTTWMVWKLTDHRLERIGMFTRKISFRIWLTRQNIGLDIILVCHTLKS